MTEQPQIVDNDKKEQQIDATVNAALAIAHAEAVQVFGEANKQHFVAYSEMDHEIDQGLHRGLKNIRLSLHRTLFMTKHLPLRASVEKNSINSSQRMRPKSRLGLIQ